MEVIKKKKVKRAGGNEPNKSTRQTRIFVLLAVGPAFMAYVLFQLYPNVLAAYYSLLEWDGIGKKIFKGLFNYKEMIVDPFMWRAMYHNLIFILVIPFVIIIISVLLAELLINKGFTENKFYKILFFFPNVLSVVVIGLLWSFIYDGNFGLLNALLKLVGIDVGATYWLGDTRTALIAVMVPMIWSGVGFYLIIIMNAMSSIPKSLYESAFIEGASDMTRLFKITLPLISGVIRVCVLFLVLYFIKGFDMVMVLTRGGPAGATDVVGQYMFSYAFGSMNTGGSSGTNYGYASAIGMFLFVILIGLKLLSDKFMPNETIEY